MFYTCFIHILHMFYICFILVLYIVYACFAEVLDTFWTCSKKVWRVKNEAFPKSFGDLWGMFWHHPWCLGADENLKKVNQESKNKVLLRSSRITRELICASYQIRNSVLALIYGLFHFLHLSYFSYISLI